MNSFGATNSNSRREAAASPSASVLAFVDVSPEADHFDVDNFDGIIDGIDDADVADPEPVAALQFSGQGFDIVMVKGIFGEFIKGGIEAADGDGIRLLVKFDGLSGKFYLIHRGGSP